MGITAAQPRRGPSQSVPPAPNDTNQFPIQSSPKFQQSQNAHITNDAVNNHASNCGPLGVKQPGTAHHLSHPQRAIPVSEVYFDMNQESDDDCADSEDFDFEDYDLDSEDDEDVEDQRVARNPPPVPTASRMYDQQQSQAQCPSMVHDMTTGAIFHIVDNPVYCNDLPKPKVGPLTPLEIAEYQRCGIDLRRPVPKPLPSLSVPVAPPRHRQKCATGRKFKCKSFITIEPNDRYRSPIRRRPVSHSPCSVPDDRPIQLYRKSAYECLTAYEIDYAKKIFTRISCPDDSKVSFPGFLKLCRRMSPRLTQLRGFMHRAAYHFRLADSDCDGRISFEEFLFAYVQTREAAYLGNAATMDALDSGCSMNERPSTPRPYSRSLCLPLAPPRRCYQRRRGPPRCRYPYVPVPVTDHQPEYLNYLDRQTIPLRDLANQINRIYDI